MYVYVHTASTLGHHYALWRPPTASLGVEACREPFSTLCKNRDVTVDPVAVAQWLGAVVTHVVEE